MTTVLSPFEKALSTIPLQPVQQSILMGRYMPLVQHLRSHNYRISLLFNGSRIIITVGSLIVPALLSILQGIANSNQAVFWTTWLLSLCVTICNAFISLFKLDKRYYYLNTILEQLISEGWQYIELTGKYSGFKTPGTKATHENQFVFFCHAYEKIRMRQIEEEYYKLTDSQWHTQVSLPGHDKNGLIPPTPQHGDLAAIPTEIIESVKRQITQPLLDGGGNKENQENRPTESMPMYSNM